jgi:hypothetical protein
MTPADVALSLRRLAVTILLTGTRLNTHESDTMFDGAGALVPFPLRAAFSN